MSKDDYKNSLAEFEKALAEKPGQKFILKLYITGASAMSSRALDNIRRFCEEHLQGRYELEVIDIYQHPELLQKDEVIAAPTLIKKLPPPLRKLIGDMSDEEKILAGLNIQIQETEGKSGKEKKGKEKKGKK
jgi:circadian clock protein KaiB